VGCVGMLGSPLRKGVLGTCSLSRLVQCKGCGRGVWLLADMRLRGSGCVYRRARYEDHFFDQSGCVCAWGATRGASPLIGRRRRINNVVWGPAPGYPWQL
jgi:hypothetical protein